MAPSILRTALFGVLMVNNEITGTWHDKFQHGEFGWTVRTATAP